MLSFTKSYSTFGYKANKYKYPFIEAFPKFRKNLCLLSFLDSSKKFIFLDKVWVGNMPQKSVFDANNKIIPNQTILREKNQ